eukprot:NODE_214_length_12495_cov_0.543078.p1 type:complete len:872 gc:universal NODE_214_length_12495_cov_0.543078:3806-1191(-)
MGLFAMVKTFGVPHLFVTFSCSEQTWPDLEEYLLKFGKKPNGNENIFTANPVLSNHYCYERLQSMFKYILKFGYMEKSISQYFQRFEFQKRGTVHMHMLLWLDNVEGPDDILNGIQGDIPSFKEQPELHLLVRYHQYHSCSNYCLGTSRKCRFNFPKEIIRKTFFDPSVARYSIKRQTKDVNINDYHADWLLKWQGNMDIKLVCNEFICNYITKYCTKPEPQGLLEVKENEITKYISTRDYSVHEISHYLSGNVITKFSTKVVKIPLCESLIDKRYIKRPKECERLKKENPEDRNFVYLNQMDNYCQRPENLENLTITDYYRKYEKVNAKEKWDFQDKSENYWKKRKNNAIIRLYPYYTEYMADFYYKQKILENVPFRNPKKLLDSITEHRSYIYEKFLGNIEQNAIFPDELSEELEIEILKEEGYKDKQILEIENMFSLKRSKKKNSPSSLGEQQYKIYKDCLFENSKYHIISGGPGTGKSFLIKSIMEGSRALNLKAEVTASTGIAGYLIDGTTVHSKLKLRYHETKETWETLLFNEKSNPVPLEMDLLIIDEFSMIDLQLFEYIMQIMQHQMFQNCKVLLFGDPKQLPPVNGDVLYSSDYFKIFKKHILTHNYRAEKDSELTYLVDNFYNIDLNKKTRIRSILEFINSRITLNTYSEAVPYIYPTNRACNNHNMAMLKSLASKVHSICFNFKNNKNSYFDLPKHSAIKSKFRFLPILEICVGARVTLLKNLSLKDGLVNGSIGMVKSVDIGINGSTIYVEFLCKSGCLCIPIKPAFEINDGYKLYQFPISLAYALTIHRVQGMTLNSIVVGNLRHFWLSQQLYVVISRVKSSSDIKFLRDEEFPEGYNESHLKFTDDLLEFGVALLGI